MARRVLFVHDSGRFEGGASRLLFGYLRGLRQIGVDGIPILSSEGDLADALRGEGWSPGVIPAARLNSTSHFPLRPGWRGLRAVLGYGIRRAAAQRALENQIREARPDVVHVFTSSLPWATAVAARRGVPVVLHVHDFPAGRMGRRLLRIAAASATRIIAVSHAVAGRVRAVCPKAEIEMLYPVADFTGRRSSRPGHEVRQALGIDDQTPVIAFVGQIIPAKGSRLLVPILNALADSLSQPVLLIVGRTEPPPGTSLGPAVRSRLARWIGSSVLREDERLEWEIRRTARGWRGVLCGFRPDVPDVLAAADVVLLPNREGEPFGLVSAEARALGVPVVAAKVPAFTEQAVSDPGLRLVEPGDIQGFARVLRDILNSPRASHPPWRVDVSPAHDEAVRRLAALYGTLASIRL
jgi:glycosyltransferase involved in cell wall biosynthesis